MSSRLSIRGLIYQIPDTEKVLFKIPELDIQHGEKLLTMFGIVINPALALGLLLVII